MQRQPVANAVCRCSRRIRAGVRGNRSATRTDGAGGLSAPLRGDHHAAEDAFQATFLVLARRTGSIGLRPNGSLGPWLHEVACRTAAKARVATVRRVLREQRVGDQRVSESVESDGAHYDDDDYRVLHEEVARLPKKYRSAVVLCYFEGLTHDEAARSLCSPVGTVSGYLAQARKLLRERLIRRGIAPALASGVLGSDLASAPAAMTPELVKSVGQAVSRGPAKAVVAWLASTIGRSMLLARIQFGLVAVCLTVAGIGCVWLFVSQRQGSRPVAEPARGISVSAAKPVDAPAGVDFFGDPLPHGAVARLGTLRFNHGTTIEQVAYSPDGRFLASLGVDGVVRLWNSSTGCEIRQVGPSDERFASMSFQPDGKTMNLEIRQVWDGRAPKVMQIDVDLGPEKRLPSFPPAAPSMPGLPSPFDLDVPEPESGPMRD